MRPLTATLPFFTDARLCFSQLPQPSSARFVQKLYNSHKGRSSHFSKPRTSTTAFEVSHYAGRVNYESAGFVEKNMDGLIPDHMMLLKASEVSTYMYVCVYIHVAYAVYG